MPQEVALIPEFTILETIHFFGHLNGMSRESLEERSRFLLRFLDLPDGQRLIRELRYPSGVSLPLLLSVLRVLGRQSALPLHWITRAK